MHGLVEKAITVGLRLNIWRNTMRKMRRTGAMALLLGLVATAYAIAGVTSSEAVGHQLDLAVDVSGSSYAVVGDNIEFLSITVSNEGESLALYHPMLSKMVISTQWSGTPVEFTHNVPNEFPAEYSYTKTLDDLITASGPWGKLLEICAEVEFEYGGTWTEDLKFLVDSNDSNNKDCHKIQIGTPLVDLTVDVSGSSMAVAGGKIEDLSIAISNDGEAMPWSLSEMVVNLTMPGGPWQFNLGLTGGLPSGHFHTTTLDNWITTSDEWGNSVEICAEVAFKNGGMYPDDLNIFVVDSNDSNNKDCHNIQIGTPLIDMKVEVSGSSTAIVGDKIENLSITVSNEGAPMAGSLSTMYLTTTWAGSPLSIPYSPTTGIQTGVFTTWVLDNLITAGTSGDKSLEICAEVEFDGGGAYIADGSFVVDSNKANNKHCHTIAFTNP